jgi:hypothetical protein
VAAKPRHAAKKGRDALTRQDNFLSAGDFFPMATLFPEKIIGKEKASAWRLFDAILRSVEIG